MPYLRQRSSGFTLVEVMAVLAILSLVGVIGVPLGMRGYASMELRQTASQLASGMGEARGRAIRTGRPVAISIDLAVPGYRVAGGRPVTLPDGIRLDAEVAAQISDRRDTAARIAFFPDGGSTGGKVGVSRQGQSYTLSVDWLTGRIEARRDES